MKGSGITLLLATAALAVTIACRSGIDSPESKVEAKAATSAITPAVLQKGQSLYKANCVACHGETGKGDGPAGGVMKPPPRDHTDRAYMSTLTDEEIGKIIQMGGAIKGKPLMPGAPQIRGDDMTALVAYVRSLSEK